MWALLRSSVRGLILSTAAHAAIIPRQDSSSIAGLVAQVQKDLNLEPAAMKPSQRVDQITAVGDSYTAGIGSNGKRDKLKNSFKCSRYDKAYPNQLVRDHGWQDWNSQTTPALNFGACSGDTTKELLSEQLKQDDVELPYISVGKPQLIVMTIGGNDVGFSDVVNDCIYRLWLPKDCETTLKVVQAAINSPELQAQIVRALGNTIAAGREAGGADPPNSFQVYISEYIRFWNADTDGCDKVSWAPTFGNKVYLTKELRSRMNSLTDQLNALIKSIALEMAGLGVVWIEGINDAYNGHRFCEKDASDDYNKAPTGADTWFWSLASKGWGDGSEGEGDASNVNDVANDLISAVVPGPLQGLVSEALPPWMLLDPAFGNADNLNDILNALPDDDFHTQVSDSWYRVFHPKGTAYTAHAIIFEQTIRRNRNSVQFNPGQCGFHLRQEWKPYPLGDDNVASYIRLFKLVDGAQRPLAQMDEVAIPHDGHTWSVTSNLPLTVEVTATPQPHWNDGRFHNWNKFSFAYGRYSWSVDDQDQNAPAHCKVGGVAGIPHDANNYWSQDMDCVFPCFPND